MNPITTTTDASDPIFVAIEARRLGSRRWKRIFARIAIARLGGFIVMHD